MRMTNKKKLLGAVAVAGIVAATGSAFTGTGLATSGQAAVDQFVGGTVSQSVTGATLTNIAYGYADAPAKTLVSSITLTFSGTADGVHVAAVPSGGTGGTFTCTDVATNVSNCTYNAADTETGYLDLGNLAVSTS